jgi:hypothetical protein
LSGVAAASHIDILDRRWTEVDFSEHEPWYATAVRGWLSMVRSIGEGHGEIAAGYRKALKVTLETRPPSSVYKLFEDYIDAMEAEASKA